MTISQINEILEEKIGDMRFDWSSDKANVASSRNEAFVIALFECMKSMKYGRRVTGVQFSDSATVECAAILYTFEDDDQVPYDGRLDFVSFHWRNRIEVYRYDNRFNQFYPVKWGFGPYFTDAIFPKK